MSQGVILNDENGDEDEELIHEFIDDNDGKREDNE